MWRPVVAALVLSAVTVAVHATGVYCALSWILGSLKKCRSLTLTYAWWLTLRLVLVLLVLHSVEVAIWSQFYIALHCFPDAETAYYFSLETYTTLGYGDVLLPRAWRVMAGWEAMIGVLMFGWSTATLVSFIHHVIGDKIKFVLPQGGISARG
jgi:voltage-gated potassium channel